MLYLLLLHPASAGFLIMPRETTQLMREFFNVGINWMQVRQSIQNYALHSPSITIKLNRGEEFLKPFWFCSAFLSSRANGTVCYLKKKGRFASVRVMDWVINSPMLFLTIWVKKKELRRCITEREEISAVPSQSLFRQVLFLGFRYGELRVADGNFIKLNP